MGPFLVARSKVLGNRNHSFTPTRPLAITSNYLLMTDPKICQRDIYWSTEVSFKCIPLLAVFEFLPKLSREVYFSYKNTSPRKYWHRVNALSDAQKNCSSCCYSGAISTSLGSNDVGTPPMPIIQRERSNCASTFVYFGLCGVNWLSNGLLIALCPVLFDSA